jgi:hypothetical protein
METSNKTAMERWKEMDEMVVLKVLKFLDVAGHVVDRKSK